MKRTLNILVQSGLLIGGVALCLASNSVAQTVGQTAAQNGPPPSHGDHGHGHGGPDMFVMLCAGQSLQGVALPVPPTKPSDAVKAKIDAAIQACVAQLPPPPSDSSVSTTTSSSSSSPSIN